MSKQEHPSQDSAVIKEKWISILDEQPPLLQGVLIALNTGTITVGYRVKKKNSHNWQIFGPLEFLGLSVSDYVTHWQALPEPPDFNIRNHNEDVYRFPTTSDFNPISPKYKP